MKRFKDLNISNKLIFSFFIILSIYTTSFLINFYQVQKSRVISNEILPLKNENINLSKIIIESGYLGQNIEKFFSVGYKNYFDNVNNNIENIIIYGENYSSLMENLLNIKGDIFYIYNIVDKDKNIKDLNIRESNVYNDIKILNTNINDLLLSNINRIESLTIKQKENTNLILKWTVLLGILMLIFIIGIGYVLIILITKPILKLRNNIINITNGDLNTKIEVESNDEIGQLGLSFNEMTSKLKESYTILETKIKERTKDLEEERASLEKRVSERTVELENLKNNLEKTVIERTENLNSKIKELELMNKLMIDRELKMVEIKDEIKELQNNINRFS